MRYTTIKDAVLNSWMKRVKELNKYDDIRLAEIRYGLEGFYLTITKLIVIMLLTILLDTSYFTLWFIVFNIPIRTVSFGFHANTSTQCLILSSMFFIFVPLLAKCFTLNLLAKCILYFFIAIGYFIMAPKDSQKKPLRNNKKRFWLKIVSVINVILYFILSLVINDEVIVNIMLLSTLTQLLMISPIPYVIFKQKYNFKWFK